jgi:hypothetical protein
MPRKTKHDEHPAATMHAEQQGEPPIFAGFQPPVTNWSPLPNELIDALPEFKSLAELKVVLYVLRHTWGFKEFSQPKHITLDELQHGRKHKDGSRMDLGTGMVKTAVIDGVKKAVEHGFLTILKNDQDKGRKERHYAIRMFESHTSDVGKSNPEVQKSIHRTEKETTRNKPQKEIPESNTYAPPPNGAARVSLADIPSLVEMVEKGEGPEPQLQPKIPDTAAVKDMVPEPPSVPPVPPIPLAISKGGEGTISGPEPSQQARVDWPATEPISTGEWDLINLETGELVETFTNPIAAKRRCKELNSIGGAKYVTRIVKPTPKPRQPPQYRDVFAALVEYYWKMPPSAAPPVTRDRAGKVAKALLANFPDATADEVRRSAVDWQDTNRKADLPLGTETMPDYFGRWRLRTAPRDGSVYIQDEYFQRRERDNRED